MLGVRLAVFFVRTPVRTFRYAQLHKRIAFIQTEEPGYLQYFFLLFGLSESGIHCVCAKKEKNNNNRTIAKI